MAIFKSLTHRPFALLWSGQFLSTIGDTIYRVALAWWILEKTGSATAMGTVFIFSSVPLLLFLLLGGVTSDRYARARVMLYSDAMRAVLVFIIAFLAFSHRLEVWQLYIASLIFGGIGAFFRPAYTAIIPEITPREHLPSANGLTGVSMEVSEIVGPAIGAYIVSLWGTPAAFGFDGLTFVVSILCLLPLVKLSAAAPATKERKSMLQDFREGLSLVRKSSWLTITMLIAALGNITMAAPFAIALPFLVKRNLNGGVGSLGLLFSMLSIGAILGTLLGTSWMERTKSLRTRGLFAYSLWIVGGLLIAVFGLPVTIYGVAAAALLAGAAFAIPNLIFITTLQELIPVEMLGRVSSIATLGSFALIPIGSGLVGWATDHIGAPTIFILAGLLTAGVAALSLIHPAIRRLDRFALPQPAQADT
jgi:DHA3 family tetracycline resistance protein-like MFS transporter